MKYAVIIVFVCIMVGVGFVSRKKTSTVGEFFLGGRDLGPWLSAFAYGTTYFSAVLFIGYAGKIGWGFGLADLWIVAGNALIGSMLAWIILAKRTRLMTTRLGAMTMPAFLAERYGSRWLKVVAAVIIFVFLIPYSASVYAGLSYLFEVTFKVNFTTALWLMAALTAAYLILGGYLAVARNDLIQGLIMIAGVILMVTYVLRSGQVGGLSGGIAKLHAVDPHLTAAWPGWHIESWTLTGILASPGVALLGLIVLTSLGPWGLPQMVHKFYAIKSTAVVRPAIIISTAFAALVAFGAYFTGALAHLFPVAAPLAQAKQFDSIMPAVLSQALPQVLLVVILLLVLSASMSTLAGLVMISSSAISIDLVQGEMKRDLSRRGQVTLLRVLIACFIVLSVVLAQQRWQLIVTLMSISWGTVSGAFIGPYVWGLWSRRTTLASAWSGIVVGLAVSLILMWHYGWDAKVAPTIGSLAMLASLIVVPLVSVLTPAPAGDRVARAFGDAAGPSFATAGELGASDAFTEGELA